jgi:hypothetical protein
MVDNKNSVTLIEPDSDDQAIQQLQMITVPILMFAIRQVFNENQAKRVNFLLDINYEVEEGFGADLDVFKEAQTSLTRGFLLHTEKLMPHDTEQNKKLNWQLLQIIFNCFALNLIIMKYEISGRLVEENDREIWEGRDVTDLDTQDLPYMEEAKKELELIFGDFLGWANENMAEAFA